MKKRILLFGLLILLGLVYVFIMINNGLENYYLLLQFIYLAPLVLALIAGFLAIKKYGLSTIHGKSFLLLVLGFALFLIGDVIWLIFEYFLEIDPFPSIADVFYLLAYPLLFVGLVIEVKAAKIKFNIKHYLTLLISFLFLGGIFLKFTVLDQLESELNFLDNFVAGLYGVGDIILVLMSLLLFGVIFEYRGGKIFRCWIWVLLNFLAMLMADLIFSIFYDIYGVSILVTAMADVLWMTSYGLFAIGMICFYATLKEKRLEILKKIKK